MTSRNASMPATHQYPNKSHVWHQTPRSFGCSYGIGYQEQELPLGPYNSLYSREGAYVPMWNAGYSFQPSAVQHQYGFPLPDASSQSWDSQKNGYYDGKSVQRSNNAYCRRAAMGAVRLNERAQYTRSLYTTQGSNGRRNSVDSSVSVSHRRVI